MYIRGTIECGERLEPCLQKFLHLSKQLDIDIVVEVHKYDFRLRPSDKAEDLGKRILDQHESVNRRKRFNYPRD